MTEYEKIVASAYTGIMFVDDFSEVHKYIEEKLGGPILTHTIPQLLPAIQDSVKDDFWRICHEEAPQ